MSDHKTLLMKCVTLLYRQTTIGENADNESLIRTVLGTINTDAPELQFNGHNVIKELKELCLQLLDKKEELDKEILLQRFKLILQNDEKYYQAIEQGILPEYDDGTTKRVIISLVKYLNNQYKEHLVTDLISKANYDLKFNKNKISNVFEYVSNLFIQLEPLSATSTSKDPALIGEVDFINEESINEVIGSIKNSDKSGSIFKTGWQDLNTMTQGGIRRGEFTTIGALQHKYKTGFSLSIFMQVALFNKPVVLENKKPLLLRISFEDSLNNNIQFMYQYLKFRDDINFDMKEIDSTPISEMSSYIMSKLNVNGFHIKMLRVDPTQWSYRDICNKIIEYEAQGYEVQLLALDYLGLVPTTGCIAGALGMDRRDQFRRVKNFCSAKNIALISPHQLSTESKQIIRNGVVPEAYFVKEIAEKGYYDGCKTLDQEIDLELYVHIFYHNKKPYLAVQRGKHRLPSIIDPDDKYFILPFEKKNMPLMDDIEGHIKSLKTLPRGESQSNNKILEEMLS